MTPAVVAIAITLSVVATILACIFIMPESKRPTLNKFFRFCHDVFNFRELLLDKVLKVLYIFSTIYCILTGFFTIFSPGYYFYGNSFLYGLLIMVIGPIVLRIIYEMLMMFVLLVRNTISINNKLSNKAVAGEEPKQEPNYRFCTTCGRRYDANLGGCPNGCQQAAAPSPESTQEQ